MSIEREPLAPRLLCTAMTTLRKRTQLPPDVVPVLVSEISRTIAWVELSEWQKDNEYIVSGYRQYGAHFLYRGNWLSFY